ncbi:MAG: exodeoxyribonuclease VII small subunit [Desulfovibrio sp.]|nr:exodeoxyribonuclease VII small subunit [Desulfovibrio sp.]
MSAKQASFEKNLERLQQIVEQLESGELPLEKGVTLYKEGLSLATSCRTQLDQARLTVSQVTPEGLKPFDADASEEN